MQHTKRWSVWYLALGISLVWMTSLEVTLVHKDIVNEVPMFGLRMHPGCFAERWCWWWQAPVVIAVTNVVSAKYSFPGICILAHSSTETIKDYHLTICRGALETVAELWVEIFFFCRFTSKSWSIHTEKHGIPVIFLKKAHGHHVVWMTIWQIFQSGSNRGADHETNTWKAPIFCRFTWLEEGVFRAMLLEAAFSREADLSKVAMLTFNLDSSCAIREMRKSISIFHFTRLMGLSDIILKILFF